MRPFLAVASLLPVLAGCASTYRVPASRPTAELTISVEMGDPGWEPALQVKVFDDEACAPSAFGLNAAEATLSGASGSTSATRILAGRRFVFTATYLDARYAMNRRCGVTGAFDPAEGRRYSALLSVNAGVESCRLSLSDVTSGTPEPVELSLPGSLCEPDARRAVPNGGGQRGFFK